MSYLIRRLINFIFSIFFSIFIASIVIGYIAEESIFMNIIEGFGTSYKYGIPNLNLIVNSLYYTFDLGIRSIFFALVFGLLLGTIEFFWNNAIFNNIIKFIGLAVRSFPSFIIAAFLQIVFSNYLKLFPTARYLSFSHKILPILSLSLRPAFRISKIFSSSLANVALQDFMAIPRMKGLSEARIFWSYKFNNSLLPVISYLSRLSVILLTGSVVVERIFVIPGMGSLFIASLESEDFLLMFSITIFYIFIVSLLYFLFDIIYFLLDPRLEKKR